MEKNKKRMGLYLYLIFVFQRLNVVFNFVLFVSLAFLVTGIVLVYIFKMQDLFWMVSKFNLILCISSALLKCLMIPVEEFLLVFVITFFENTKIFDDTKLYNELLDLPTNLLGKLNLLVKGDKK